MKGNLIACLIGQKAWCNLGDGKEELYLLELKTNGNLLADFLTTYEDELDDFRRKIAGKVFPDKFSEQNYGLFFDKKRSARFAYNCAFANYEKKKGLIYTPPEELLLAGNKDFSKIPGEIPNSDIIPGEEIAILYGFPPRRPPNTFKYGFPGAGSGRVILYGFPGTE